MYCQEIRGIVLFIATVLTKAHGQDPIVDRAEQLRQWIESNRDSLPFSISDDLSSAITSGNNLASTILKIFGFVPEPEVSQFTRTTSSSFTPHSGVKVADREVCPFGADPLLLSGEFSYCKPTTIGECPAGFVCDFSVVLGRSVCCQDMRNQPIINIKLKPSINSTVQPKLTKTSSRVVSTTKHQYTRWSSTLANRRTPWFIRDRNSWRGLVPSDVSLRTTMKPLAVTQASRLSPTKPALNTLTSEVPIEERNNSTAKTIVTLTTEQREIPNRKTSEFHTFSMGSLQTTSSSTSSSLPSKHNSVFVSLLQTGEIKKLTDTQTFITGTITLVNDYGYRVLVDTGSATDTETLLQEMYSGSYMIQPEINFYRRHLKLAGFIVCLIDLIFLSAPLIKALQMYSNARTNPVIAAWLTACILLYVLHVLCILANWYGVLRSQPLWMIPKLVLKLLTILICITVTCVMGYFVWNESPILRFLIAKNRNMEYYAAKSTMMLMGLSKEMTPIDDIAIVVITSGHPSHIGNLNIFPQKPVLYHTLEFLGQNAIVTELKDRPYRKLTENIEVWKTPGSTQQSLSVLVHNVYEYGTLAITGDLIPAEDYILNRTISNEEFDENVWDSLIRRQNSNLIVCLADWIIPGHGQPFRVVPRYRQRAGCTRLLAQRKAFGKM